jgi:hypothetical protein
LAICCIREDLRLLVYGSRLNAAVDNLHHRSADHGENQHGHPARDETEAPENVTNNIGQAQLSNLSVEGVEEAIDTLESLLLVGVAQSNNVIRGNGGGVEPLLIDVYGGRLREHLKHPEVGGSGAPGVAEDRLVIAVDVAHVRAAGEDGELASGLVEGGVDPVATAFAKMGGLATTMNMFLEGV